MVGLVHHQLKDEWRFAITTSGELSVMTHGIVWMPMLLAFNLATAMRVCLVSIDSDQNEVGLTNCLVYLQGLLASEVLYMVRVLDQLYWDKFNVLEMNQLFLIVLMM